MPNLNQTYALKQKYSTLNYKDWQVKEYLEKSISKETLKKAFNIDNLETPSRDVRLFSFLNESLEVKKPELIKYFDEAKEEDVALLFIDITSFSRTISGFNNSQIKVFLDEYYENIIPIIYKHGGEIEKLMGDGIICVFGKPFLKLDSPEYVYHAESCAKEIIQNFHNTPKNVKVAIHKGLVNYYKVPGEYYGEYTIIGQPITDLYRLESISKPNAVNFYKGSPYDRLGWVFSQYDSTMHKGEFDTGYLQGVLYNKAAQIKFKGYE